MLILSGVGGWDGVQRGDRLLRCAPSFFWDGFLRGMMVKRGGTHRVARVMMWKNLSMIALVGGEMKLYKLLFLLLLFISTPAHAFQLPMHSSRGDYQFPVDGPFHNMEIHLTWREAKTPPAQLGYYAMFMFYFQNKAGGYMGLQWDNQGKRAIFSLWDAQDVPGSAAPEGECKRFGHEGSGAQCFLPYPWEMGREYLLRLALLSASAKGERWQATIRDLGTGREQVIGVIEAKNSAGQVGYGRLTGRSVNVLEYYGHARMDDCQALPVVLLRWRGPFADDRRMRAKGVQLGYSSRAECRNSTIASPQSGQLEQQAGGGTVRSPTQEKYVHWPQLLLE
jgi:hypothetical protein